MRHMLFCFLILVFGVVVSESSAQNLINGDLDGVIGNNAPNSWDRVDMNDPNCIASIQIAATVDVVNTFLPGNGLVATPFSGPTAVSGLHATVVSSTGNVSVYHEGIEQLVTGFTPGDCYTLSFYQCVMRQENCMDTSGSWQVFLDQNLLATTTPSTTQLAFDDPAVDWDYRSMTFVATANTHLIQILPWDDDTSIFSDIGADMIYELDGALRMGIDLVEIVNGSTLQPVIDDPGVLCAGDAQFTITSNVTGGTWTGTGIVDQNTGDFDPAIAGVGLHEIIYTTPPGPCSGGGADTLVIEIIGADASWGPVSDLCAFDAPLMLDSLINGDTGGVWSGTGVVGNTFDPSYLAGTTVTITYDVGTVPCNSSQSNTITVLDENSALCDTLFGGENPDIYCYVPNAFTPDGDFVNDGFGPVFAYPELITEYELLVFDRWGHLVFESEAIDERWYGAGMTGVYVWKLRCVSAGGSYFERVGHVCVLY